jgi:DNA-binding SARP family transcriptional activator
MTDDLEDLYEQAWDDGYRAALEEVARLIETDTFHRTLIAQLVAEPCETLGSGEW